MISDKRVIAILLFLPYVIKELWTVFPESACVGPCTMDCSHYGRPFIFSDQGISKQTYVSYACIYWVFFMFQYLIYLVWNDGRFLMKWYCIFAVLEIIEYFLTYNEPICRISTPFFSEGIPFHLGAVRYTVMFILTIIQITRWSNKR
jgi:hypothetical protein